VIAHLREDCADPVAIAAATDRDSSWHRPYAIERAALVTLVEFFARMSNETRLEIYQPGYGSVELSFGEVTRCIGIVPRATSPVARD